MSRLDRGREDSHTTICYDERMALYENSPIFYTPIEKNSISDSYNVAVAPYIDVYITEIFIGAWLVSAKERFTYLKDVDIVELFDFFHTKITNFSAETLNKLNIILI